MIFLLSNFLLQCLSNPNLWKDWQLQQHPDKFELHFQDSLKLQFLRCH